jgi:RNA-splicing ligase RtcB
LNFSIFFQGVPFDEETKQQLLKAAQLPIIYPHIAAMPDVQTFQ